tara:strand:+ start:1308 stop:2681 length:1374 start_codon:yes stop_codon:yes gene_type:complete
MGNLKEFFYAKSPNFIQNSIVSIYNILAYRSRYSGKYKAFKEHYYQNKHLSIEQLADIQSKKYETFIHYSKKNSKYYNKVLSKLEFPISLSKINELPIVDKETLRININEIYTIKKEEGHLSKTGGTTGKSLQVIYTKDDVQERMAILDTFRNNFGYKLGKRTAWFSGKKLLNNKDIKKNRFWKTDFFYNVRYYSTFHIHSKYLEHYIKNLILFKPEYMVGFPSTMYEIAKYGQNNGINFPANVIKAIFPTAETITPDIRNMIEGYFKTNLYNQYASSEGAPFILECVNKKLHLELQSGVFEVLDNKNKPSNKGRLVITSFNTHGTPLIRYDIGDEIELSNEGCTCGNNNPLVKEILGRVSDYIYSEETGKINLGNISNCLKGVNGIVKFQIQQETIESLLVLIEKDEKAYANKDEQVFITNLRERVGNNINIEIQYVSDIPVEKSGKFRLVKNFLK